MHSGTCLVVILVVMVLQCLDRQVIGNYQPATPETVLEVEVELGQNQAERLDF